MSVIYEPSGKAREYSKLACNLFVGCQSGCVYCYAAGKSDDRQQFHSQVRSRENILTRLRQSAEKRGRGPQLGLFDQYQRNERDAGQVLLCFTSDPYQNDAEFLGITRGAIKILHDTGHTVCVLTKNGDLAPRDLDLFGAGDAFATTLTLLGAVRSRLWEPNAALPMDRIRALRLFKAAGIRTWVSLEPVIDPGETLKIITQTSHLVDHYKVGKLNYIDKLPASFQRQVLGINWNTFARDVVYLLDRLGYRRSYAMGEYEAGTYYVKESLARYL